MENRKKRKQIFSVSNIISAFYFISGVILLASISLINGLPIHLALIGVLNISASYSLTRMRKWSLYVIVANSLISLVFGCTSLIALIFLFNQNATEVLMLLGLICYLMISVIALIYIIEDFLKK